MADRKPSELKNPLNEIFPSVADVFFPATPQVDELAKGCTYVFDANALIAPYRIGRTSFAAISKILLDLHSSNRLLIPEQAILEYGKNRTEALKETYDHVNSLWTSLPIRGKDLEAPMLEGFPQYAKALETVEPLDKAISAYKKALGELKDAAQAWTWNDEMTKTLAKVCSGDTIIKAEQSYDEIVQMAEERYTLKIPPGYKDHGKPDGGPGDLIIWLSILTAGKKAKRDIILVSNEEKGDWVVSTQKTVLGIRTELASEFYRHTGKHFALVNFPKFLQLTNAPASTVDAARVAAQNELDYSSTLDSFLAVMGVINSIALKVLKSNEQPTVRAIEEHRLAIAHVISALKQLAITLVSSRHFEHLTPEFHQVVKSANSMEASMKRFAEFSEDDGIVVSGGAMVTACSQYCEAQRSLRRFITRLP